MEKFFFQRGYIVVIYVRKHIIAILPTKNGHLWKKIEFLFGPYFPPFLKIWQKMVRLSYLDYYLTYTLHTWYQSTLLYGALVDISERDLDLLSAVKKTLEVMKISHYKSIFQRINVKFAQ